MFSLFSTTMKQNTGLSLPILTDLSGVNGKLAHRILIIILGFLLANTSLKQLRTYKSEENNVHFYFIFILHSVCKLQNISQMHISYLTYGSWLNHIPLWWAFLGSAEFVESTASV